MLCGWLMLVVADSDAVQTLGYPLRASAALAAQLVSTSQVLMLRHRNAFSLDMTLTFDL